MAECVQLCLVNSGMRGTTNVMCPDVLINECLHLGIIAKENTRYHVLHGQFFVNTSGKAGAQIPHPPLGDDSPPWGR
jgi:hypothetical protein